MAAADYAEGLRPLPPDDLYYGMMTRVWGMPFAGGWMEQPAGLLNRMSTLLNVHDAMQDWRRSRNWASWVQRRPDQYKIVANVIKLRSNGKK